MQQLSERTLGQWLEYWAEKTPDKEYIVYSDRDLRFTWKVFNERVDNLAKGLLSIGVKKGSNVGICFRSSRRDMPRPPFEILRFSRPISLLLSRFSPTRGMRAASRA